MKMPAKQCADYAYRMGVDYGKKGATAINCHFSIFSLVVNARAWEKGERDAKKEGK